VWDGFHAWKRTRVRNVPGTGAYGPPNSNGHRSISGAGCKYAARTGSDRSGVPRTVAGRGMHRLEGRPALSTAPLRETSVLDRPIRRLAGDRRLACPWWQHARHFAARRRATSRRWRSPGQCAPHTVACCASAVLLLPSRSCASCAPMESGPPQASGGRSERLNRWMRGLIGPPTWGPWNVSAWILGLGN